MRVCDRCRAGGELVDVGGRELCLPCNEAFAAWVAEGPSLPPSSRSRRIYRQAIERLLAETGSVTAATLAAATGQPHDKCRCTLRHMKSTGQLAQDAVGKPYTRPEREAAE